MSVSSLATSVNRNNLLKPALVGSRVPAKTTTGLIQSAKALNSTTISVQFKSRISPQLATKLRFEIAGLEVTRIQMSRDGRTALLTTRPQENAVYTTKASLVRGRPGNSQVKQLGTARVPGVLTPKVVSVTPLGDTSILVTYNQPMSASAALPQNYQLADESGNSVRIAGAGFVAGGTNQVALQTAPQSFASYSFNINNVTDTRGQQVFFEGRKITGNPKGAVISVAATSSTRVVVAFNEPMADNALAPQHYSIKDPSGKSLLVTDAQFDGPLTMVVILTTAAQADVNYQLNVANVTDLINDPLTTSTGTFQGIAAPALSRVVATDANSLVLTFTGPVGDSALAPSTYLIERLDSLGNVIGTLAINAAAFVGDQRTVVALSTPPQSEGRYRISTTAALTDVAGSALPIVQIQFQGVTGQPTLVGATSTGPSSILLTFDLPMSDDALSPSSYVLQDANGLPFPVLNVRFIGTERRIVELTTPTQTNQNYTIVSIGATAIGGGATILPTTPSIINIPGLGTPGETTPIEGAPRVVGAASLSNTEVIVAFSEPMSASAINKSFYFIVQQNVNSESGYLQILDATWYDPNHSVVKLTTLPQNELTYAVTAVAATDVAGNALAPATIGLGGVVINPTTAQFPGTPPTVGGGGTLPDTDGDGLPDNVEMRGWRVTVQLVDGTTESRTVTSDPTLVDTDGDGLSDYQEANIRTDPRSQDSDDDQLNDYAEFNEIYSNALSQDSDGDSLDDFLEYTFFKTSPVFADTDGDQLRDDYEIVSNRNPRVSDLPRPEVEVGTVNLQLDVRFTETNEQQRRDLETRQVATTLSASSSQTHTRSDTANIQAHIEGGYEPGAGNGRGSGFIFGSVTAGYTFQSTDESATSTQREYQNSLSTDREVSRGFNVERQVQGAVMQVALSLRNVSNLAYRVKNLQVTAFIQDPIDRTKLTPLATLLPDSEPEEGFTLGPLVTNRGPFVFTNSTIVPTLVESLMANSAGLVFRIANYDIIDEAGRNFAFSSQEVVERTSALVLDFGGARSLLAQVSGEPIDENQPGDETEIHRVALSGGRAIADTNEDGRIDRDPRELFDASGNSLGFDYDGDGAITDDDETYVPDTPVVFDGSGKGVGISLYQALAAAGLTRYVEATTPTVNLTDDQILGSYSVFVDGAGREKIHRIRGVVNDTLNRKFWEILTPLGVDANVDLSTLILKANSPISLNFVQDLDGDGLTADVEFFLRTSDNPELVNGAPKGRDTDGDSLDDRFEALIGWTVTTPQRNYKVWSSPNRRDSNFDGLTDLFTAPGGWVDLDGDGLRDRFNEVSQLPPQNGVPDYVLDPIRLDTDGDGINDAEELAGFDIVRITDGSTIFRRTDPTNRDTDFDTFSDGFEKRVGLDPTDGDDIDTDGDGLPDPVELSGWDVTTFDKSDSPYVQGTRRTVRRTSKIDSADSDGDGLTDFEEFFLGTNARAADTDGDGIKDIVELRGFALPHQVGGKDLGIITTDPLDADTDNDKRSDGAEAELIDVELARWVVRPDGETPYRVYSNPLVADADFDGVVDGDEFADLNGDGQVDAGRYRTDPNNGNTDGDKRDDGKEFLANTNPLVEDFQVTVFFTSLTITRDGDEGGAGPGDFGFDLGFRGPDNSRPAGLSTEFTSVLRANGNLIAPFQYGLGRPGDPQVSPTEAALPALDSGQTQQSLRNNGPSIYGINMDDGATLNFAKLLPESLRSRSFGMTKNDFFSIEGIVIELDSFGGGSDSLTSVYLGGLEGVRAEEKAKDADGGDVTNTIRPVFYGLDLLAAPERFRDLTFTFKTSDNQLIGSNPGAIEGSLSMFFIVS